MDGKKLPEDNYKYNKLLCNLILHVAASISRGILHHLACEQFYIYLIRLNRLNRFDRFDRFYLWCQIIQVY